LKTKFIFNQQLSVSSQGSFTRKASLSPTSPNPNAVTTSSTITNEAGITRTNLKVSFKDRIRNLQKESAKEEKLGSNEASDAKQHLIPSTSAAKPKKPSTTQQLKDKIKSFSQIPKDELTPWSKLKLATVVSLGGSYSSLTNSITGDSPKLSKTTIKSSMPVDLNAVNKLDGPLKSGRKSDGVDLTCDDQKTSVSDSELKSATETEIKIKRKPKPFKLLSEPKRNYRSVDDLSPEYSGLPFVKKLKILNERQKLAELESVIQTRSFSLDCTDSSNSNEMVEVLTRSHSEASCMVTRPKCGVSLSSPIVPVAPLNFNNTQVPSKSPQSPESNETLERKQLKSILKRLSEDRLAQNVNVKAADRPEMKRLMRAQTVEGYVARRSNFTKSVTFNNTLSSPPNSATLAEEPEESSKLSSPQNPSPFSPRPALYPISNAQEISTSISTSTVDKSQTLLSNRILRTTTEMDQSTNRFNFSDDFVTESTTTTTIIEKAPLTPNPSIDDHDDPSRCLSFVSDDYGSRKIVKGIQIVILERLCLDFTLDFLLWA
jgi:hypothetical protein